MRRTLLPLLLVALVATGCHDSGNDKHHKGDKSGQSDGSKAERKRLKQERKAERQRQREGANLNTTM